MSEFTAEELEVALRVVLAHRNACTESKCPGLCRLVASIQKELDETRKPEAASKECGPPATPATIVPASGLEGIFGGKYHTRSTTDAIWSEPFDYIGDAITCLLSVEQSLRFLALQFFSPEGVVREETRHRKYNNGILLERIMFGMDGSPLFVHYDKKNDTWNRSYDDLGKGVYVLARLKSDADRLRVLNWFCRICGAVKNPDKNCGCVVQKGAA